MTATLALTLALLDLAYQLFVLAFCFGLAVGSVLKVVSLNRALRNLGQCPGRVISWIHPFHPLSFVVGSVFPPKRAHGSWYARFKDFKHFGSTCYSTVHFWTGTPIYWLCDAEALKFVMSDKGSTIIKDAEPYDALRLFGESILGAEGADWRRHRTVVNPAFNDSNLALVWRESVRLTTEWFEEMNDGGSETKINLNDSMSKLALLVISAAGFGRRIPWDQDTSTEELTGGHKVTFDQAILGFLPYLFVRLVIPTWAFSFTEHFNIPLISKFLARVKMYTEEMQSHVLETISAARADALDKNYLTSMKESRMDGALLRNLVEANMVYSESSSKRLTDGELFSDTFAFLMAGHETVAHTLCFAITFMALYPKVQEKVFGEVCQLWPEGVPNDDVEYTTAVIHETLRLYPVVPRLSKKVMKDFVLHARCFAESADGETEVTSTIDVCLTRASFILIDISALHRNPIYWGKDAGEYKPEHFIDSKDYHWPRDAFLAFSGGARGCIGQRFALVESICVLARIVRDYEILLPENVIGLPVEEQEERLMKWIPGATTAPTHAAVRFRYRI